MVKTSRVVWRLLILATLTGCLLFVISDQRRTTAATTCTTCDANYSNCESSCYSDYTICVNSGGVQAICFQNYEDCRDTCFNTYAFCLGGCTLSSGTVPSGCGRGRTSCELACRSGRGECIANGGTNCGADYEACNVACCGG